MSDDRIKLSVPGPFGRVVFTTLADHRAMAVRLMTDSYIKGLLEEGEWEIEIRPKEEEEREDQVAILTQALCETRDMLDSALKEREACDTFGTIMDAKENLDRLLP